MCPYYIIFCTQKLPGFHIGPAINRLMQAGAYYYCLLNPEKLLPADVTIPKGWWIICFLHGHEELLAGREIIMVALSHDGSREGVNKKDTFPFLFLENLWKW